MSHADWKDVAALVLTLVGREQAPLQIFFWLAVAFALTMMLEGLRASFLPWRPVAPARSRGKNVANTPASPQRTIEAAAGPTHMRRIETTPLSGAYRLHGMSAPNRKRAIAVRKPQRTLRPHIRRAPADRVTGQSLALAEAEPPLDGYSIGQQEVAS